MAINNPLSPRLIYNEINGTSHGANATIGSGVTMSSLRTASITYGNANSAPDIMSDWNGYTHTVAFGDATTYANVGTTLSDYVSYVFITRAGNEPLARSANIFYFKLNGTTVEFYVVPDHTQTGVFSIQNEDAYFYETAGSSSSYTGDFTNGFTAKKIASISGDPQSSGSVLSGLTASMTKTHLSGTGTNDLGISGYTILSSGATAAPHASTLNAIAPMADSSAACNNTVDNDSFDKIEFKVQATGYVEKSVATFVARTRAVAQSTSCL